MMKALTALLFACAIPACMSQGADLASDQQATTGSGTTSVLLGRGTFAGPFKVERKNNPEWGGVDLKAFDDLDVAVQTITFQPGGKSGWHSHPGPVLITVQTGTMTFYDSGDPNCAPIVVTAGHGFVDGGDEHAHIARNETTSVATNVVVYLAAPTAAIRIDQPQPANCPVF